MDPVLKRFSFRITPARAGVILIAGIIIAAAFWIGPLRSVPAELQLLVSMNGQYVSRVSVDSTRVRRGGGPDSVIWFPLRLAVRNVGASSARPTAVYLSVPARFRLLASSGKQVPGWLTPGNPLIQYRLDLKPVTIQPGAAPRPLAPNDRVWLEPALPDYYCTFAAGGVPEFVPAPVSDPELISNVEIFYSFATRSDARQTGLLTVVVDPVLLRKEGVPLPPVSETTLKEPEAERPKMESIVKVGSRVAQCGEPDQNIELRTELWETPRGGRFFVVFSGATPRKHLFDLDRDGVIELEMWDPDGDGDFEARRSTQLRIPSFLFPILPSTTLAGGEAAEPDSAWLRNFYDVAAGPGRFIARAPDTLPPVIAQPSVPPPAPGPGMGAARVPEPSQPPPPARLAPGRRPAPGPPAQTRSGPPRPSPVQPRPADTPRLWGMPIKRPRPDTATDTTGRPLRRDTLRRDLR